jgi:hypothetical protein
LSHGPVLSAGEGSASCSHVNKTGSAILAGWIMVDILGSRQSSPPKPAGHSHFPLYSLHSENWPH